MKRSLAICSLLLFVTILSYAPAVAADGDNYTLVEFKNRFDQATDEADGIRICREFVEKADDIDVVRQAQSQWEAINAASALEYARLKAEANPESPKHLYLFGRLVDSDMEKIEIGRKVISLDPSWSYGYRLMLATYVAKLFRDKSDGEYREKLQAMFQEDRAYFEKLADIDPGESYALEFLSARQIYEGDFASAKATYDKARALGGRWPSDVDYITLQVLMGEYEPAMAAFRKQADDLVVQGQLSEGDKEEFINYYFTSALYEAEAFDEVIRFKQRQPGWETDPGALYDIACAYARSGNTEASFEFLNKATGHGWEEVEHITRDEDLTALHGDTRWSSVIEATEANWDAGEPKRKAKTLAEKIDEPAPNWSLEDVNGNLVSLNSLRGKVLVLDFWATWCGPCRMAMPVINEFVRANGNEGVKVFSVNVWESGKAKPADFMNENDYAMTLLYGNDDLAKAYGISGIPFLCVIDKEGNIRYRHTGYSEGLDEKLKWWTEDLL